MILAKHNDGTLLENFLVTVGFQKGLVLNTLGRKNKKLPPPLPKTKTAKIKSPIEKETTPQSDQLSGLPEQEAKVSRTPEVELDSPSSTSFNKISAIAYTVVVNRVQSRSLLSGTIWAAPEYYTSACPEFFVT